MLFNNVSIHTVAHLEAPIRVTSAEISERLAKTLKRVRLPLNYLERTTGIKERRFWEEGTQPSDAATLVAEAVIKKSGLSKSDIGVVINTSISKDFIEPSVACIVHGNLELSQHCINFDIGNACLGFSNGIHIAATMIEGGQVDHVLVVAAENFSNLVKPTILRLEQDSASIKDVREQLATLTLGSGAVAMIISRADLAPLGHRLKGLVLMAAAENNRLCCAWNDRGYTDAPKLLKAGLTLCLHTISKAIGELNIQLSQFDEFAVHQISKVHASAFKKMVEVESNKILFIYENYGNMGSVSTAFSISKLIECNRLKSGKKLAVIGIGSGLNCMVMDLQW
jgi:3-oxoacyl-[acyl-carrier-protein] synthase-3